MKTEERNCCFEISTPDNRTMVFQAENELELLDWIRIFENAKSHALLTTKNANINAIDDSSNGDNDLIVEKEENVELKYPTKELKEFSKNVKNTLLLTFPYNLVNDHQTSGRVYFTNKEILLFPFSTEQENTNLIEWDKVRDLKLETIGLYPRLKISTSSGSVEITALIKEEKKILDKMFALVKKYSNSDPQELLNRLYDSNGANVEEEEELEGLELENINVGSKKRDYDFTIPKDISSSEIPLEIPDYDKNLYDTRELDIKINLPVHILFQVLFLQDKVSM